MNIYILFLCIIVFIVFVLVYNHIVKNNKCDSGYQCQNGVCVSLAPTSITPIMGSESSSCVPDINPIPTSLIPGVNPIPTSLIPVSPIPEISDQPNNTVQLINDTVQDPLHLFIGTGSTEWTKIDGNGYCYPSIQWGPNKQNPNDHTFDAWDPIGAGKFSEVVIPRGGNIILGYIGKFPFRVTPVMMNSNFNTNITTFNMASTKVLRQKAILIECAGMDTVANVSAVDGVNFRMKYELTVADPNPRIGNIIIDQNPCANLDENHKIGVDVGCPSPYSVDCGSSPSCDCCFNTQKCKFNACSNKLFSIENSGIPLGKYDAGDPNSCNDCPDGKCPETSIVKKFVENLGNLRQGGQTQLYCSGIHSGSKDYTAYCYDYNDKGSSPTLAAPYKIRAVYSDL